MRDSMVIYRSFFNAIKELPKENQADVWNAVYEYGFDQNEVELTGLSKTIFILIKPQIEANIKRYKNGKQPKTKQKESKTEAKQKQEISKSEANVNDNVNVNVNENVNKNIPEIEDFVAYALEQFPKVEEDEVRLKYKSWLVNGWCTNKDNKLRPIKNWKSTLLNTLPYMKEKVITSDDRLVAHIKKTLNLKHL